MPPLFFYTNKCTAPSCGRILADHGAEVVRVEPPSGDMWRNYLKILERERPTFVSTFEHTSFNKSSVTIDYTTDVGLAQLKSLIAGCDVFITNVRLPPLQRAGLDYASIKDEFPHVVYAHLSAWGLVGPERAAPGYDFGAFWSQTGMANLVSTPGNYAQYPGAFGDTVAGANLAGGIARGLRARLTNGGFGCFLETSLLRVGMWVLAPQILRDAASKSDAGTVQPPPPPPPTPIPTYLPSPARGCHSFLLVSSSVRGRFCFIFHHLTDQSCSFSFFILQHPSLFPIRTPHFIPKNINPTQTRP